MGLDPVERAGAGDLRAPEGVGDDLADVREDVRLPATSIQLRLQGQAGDCQVDGARTFATLNIGGSLTTTVSFVVTREN